MPWQGKSIEAYGYRITTGNSTIWKIARTMKKRIAAVVNRILLPFGALIITQNAFEEMHLMRSQLNELVEKVTIYQAGHHLDDAVKNVSTYAMRAHWRLVDMIEEISSIPSETTCALCGYTTITDAFDILESKCIFFGGRLQRLRCPSCEVIFGPKKMLQLDEASLDHEYRTLYQVYSEGDSTDLELRAFHLLQPQREGKYLNFGCGGGWSKSMQILRDDEWNVFGFEPSASNASSGILKTWEELSSHVFDGIYSNNVLEHLFDPAGTLSRLNGLLRPGSRMVHVTPCFDYLYEFTRFHVFFFTGRSPEVLAEKTGMHILDWVRDGEFIACIMAANHK